MGVHLPPVREVLPNGLPFSCRKPAGRYLQNGTVSREVIDCHGVLMAASPEYDNRQGFTVFLLVAFPTQDAVWT
jgi:hypothetical protein